MRKVKKKESEIQNLYLGASFLKLYGKKMWPSKMEHKKLEKRGKKNTLLYIFMNKDHGKKCS